MSGLPAHPLAGEHYKDLPGLTLIGIGGIIVALAVAFFFVKRMISSKRKCLPSLVD